ncbi:MAG: tyrosine--tRNA ligase [Erysipelotrichaceae bacterium]|nr:tyrosine--tRNA ligase [Erysipelotrichaceae bacterium]
MNIIDELRQRGYIEQVMFEDSLKELLEKEKITFYIGFDPTADSLHIGHLIQLMVISKLQKAGHRPIVLIGDGTAMIGDPSDRNDMRQMLSVEQLKANTDAVKKQVERFVSFEGENAAILLTNGEWLTKLNLLEYMRDVGVHFNVNKMLAAECYKARLKDGLTFFEMTYMTLQAYDFMHLYEKYNCKLQVGGNDQWSNVIAGVGLNRKKYGVETYAIGTQLLANADGTKMGKTMGGALWLDKDKLSPYEFYQHFVNIEDASVKNVLKQLTYLPLEAIEELMLAKYEEINEVKKIAAFEITKIVHGEEEAIKARESSEAMFGEGVSLDGVPEIEGNIGDDLIDIAIKAGFGSSRGQIKTLIKQEGLSLNEELVLDMNYTLKEEDFKDNIAIIKKGKKIYYKIVKQ